ncbi:hypothetical protein FEE95_10900 [Maribacter algarum]|uniref:TonB-dependent receptor plug domain-containing protein n=1 Tax=Maribacter algarum (ex Zhang et al. 2020) TaxID=2578118 RepID=A0A5S3PSV4_9FLAO|nr:TonB-dependent receptor plug domain-containing protein [Maribacter algarum]TMM56993.1 hypothetical protein FEE95_10900 [Maribacter algarum]
MKNLVTFFLLICSLTVVQAQSKYIKGKLTHFNTPLANAEIRILDSETLVKTKTDGSYSISAEIGDVISYSYPSLETVEIIVEDVTTILNVQMTQKIEELDEVVVKGSNRKSQEELALEYPTNPNLIRTAWGILNKETSGGTIRFLPKEQITDVSLCILDLLRNEMPGVRVFGDCIQGGGVTIRGVMSLTQSNTAIYDVDGQIFQDTPLWILPAAIERVAVLSSLSSTAQYGTAGGGGVVVINTKVGTVGIGSSKLKDQARLRNNKYQNDALNEASINKNLPTYLEELYASSSIEIAKEIYLKNRALYRNAPHYFLDAYNYFMSNRETEYANQIIENQMYLFEDHPVYSKALGYHLDAHGEHEKAKDLYEQVFILRPSYAQSYRDLAESYREVGNYKKSASMYARHNYLLNEGFLSSDSVGILPVIERESENLLALEGDKVIDGGKITRRLAKYTEFDGTRLLFEWNDSEAEFELQFVNPEKHFHTWKHTMLANSERIKDEKEKGYSCQEFLVDGSLPGIWRVNMNYKGNKKLEPSYLKVTRYYNYGKPSQQKRVSVYRLGLKNVNYQLFDLVNSSSTSSN